MPLIDNTRVMQAAAACGFELAGVARAYPVPDAARYSDWVARGLAGEMAYLTDHRADIRLDPARLLPSVRSIVCVGKYYGGPEQDTAVGDAQTRGWISRYAWGEDYHGVVRLGLEKLAAKLIEDHGPFEWRACVDTAPLLERSYARAAGLGWIGKNTCLINQQRGSWFFLGELLTSLDVGALPVAAPNRCGSCTRCIDACPTQAIVSASDNRQHGAEWELDARRCISYFTIELRGDIPEAARPGIGQHIFGCDICQDVCPWNELAAGHQASEPAPEFRPASQSLVAPPLAEMAALNEAEFRAMFRASPVTRAKYRGFLRNVAVAMGNSANPALAEPLLRLAQHDDPLIADAARWALERLQSAVKPL